MDKDELCREYWDLGFRSRDSEVEKLKQMIHDLDSKVVKIVQRIKKFEYDMEGLL